MWLLRGASGGGSAFFALFATHGWVRKRSLLTALAVPPPFVFMFMRVWQGGCRATNLEAVVATTRTFIGWPSENEPLFGERRETKLIVLVRSFGTQALFKWKGKSLGHGDIHVMDGQCQDEFPHCTGSWPGTGGFTLRFFGSGDIFPPVLCGQGQCVACQRVRRFIWVHLRIGVEWWFGVFWLLPGASCKWRF